MSSIRLLTPDDAPVLVDLFQSNRAFLAPWSPLRSDAFFELSSQRATVASDLAEYQANRMLPFVICGTDGDREGYSNVFEVNDQNVFVAVDYLAGRREAERLVEGAWGPGAPSRTNLETHGTRATAHVLCDGADGGTPVAAPLEAPVDQQPPK